MSENGSDDTSFAMSEVSCDDVPPRFSSKISGVQYARQTPSSVSVPVPAVPVSVSMMMPTPTSSSSKKTDYTLLSAVDTPIFSHSQSHNQGTLGLNSIPKGNLLDAGRSSAVSNMLQSAKQKVSIDQSDSSDDDNW